MNNFSLMQQVIKRATPSYRTFMKQLALCILASVILLAYSACTANHTPSDKEAIRLVSEYYLYYGGGEKVNVSISKREGFNDGCKCYPVKFNIFRSKAPSGIKKFYFFKSESGKFTLK